MGKMSMAFFIPMATSHKLSETLLRRVKPCPKHMLTSRESQQCDDKVWQDIKKQYKAKRVFINVPYEPNYETIRHTIWATCYAVGLTAVFASEKDTSDIVRLCKLCALMQSCKYCITDLSSNHLHNMPFELKPLLERFCGFKQQKMLLYGTG